MISFSSSSSESEQASHRLRRSDRKRTKKIFKQDLVDSASIRHRTGKKLRTLKTNQNIQTIFNPYTQQLSFPINLFQLNSLSNNIEALKQMKQAVNRQQIKYEKLLEIKLIAQSNKPKQNHKLFNQEKYFSPNQNHYVQGYQNQRQYIYENNEQADCERDLVRMATGTDQMYLQFQCLQMHSSDQENNSLSAFNMVQYPQMGLGTQIMSCRRKQSAIMLSDNYENDELMYNMQQLQPQWLREEYIENVDW